MTSLLKFRSRCVIIWVPKSKIPHLQEYLGGGRPGWGLYSPRTRLSDRDNFWKTTRRDRARVFAKFEIPRRVRGTSPFRKKKACRGRGLALDPRLDPSIPRSSNSLAHTQTTLVAMDSDLHPCTVLNCREYHRLCPQPLHGLSPELPGMRLVIKVQIFF